MAYCVTIWGVINTAGLASVIAASMRSAKTTCGWSFVILITNVRRDYPRDILSAIGAVCGRSA